jgi:hypothetical protein
MIHQHRTQFNHSRYWFGADLTIPLSERRQV